MGCRPCSITSSATPTSTWSPSPTTSGSTARSARASSTPPATTHFELVVGEEITTRRGHLLALFLRSGSRPCARWRRRSSGSTTRAGIAIAPHPMAPLTPSLGRRSLLRLHHDPDARHRLDAIEMLNPSVAGRARRSPGARSTSGCCACRGRQLGRARARARRPRPGPGSAARAPTDYRAAMADGAAEAEGQLLEPLAQRERLRPAAGRQGPAPPAYSSSHRRVAMTTSVRSPRRPMPPQSATRSAGAGSADR